MKTWLKGHVVELTAISFAITLLSIFIAIYSIYSAKKFSEISFSHEEKIIAEISEEHAIDVYINENIVEKGFLKEFRYILWNSGNIPINSEDVRQVLAVRGENFDIISAEIKNYYPRYSNFTLGENLREIGWSFFDADTYVEVVVLAHSAEDFDSPQFSMEAPNFTEFLDYCKKGKPFFVVFFIAAVLSIFTIYVAVNTISAIFSKVFGRKRKPFIEILDSGFAFVVLLISFFAAVFYFIPILNYVLFGYFGTEGGFYPVNYWFDLPIYADKVACNAK